MKVLRFAVLMMTMSGAALLPMQAYGQQEVDPDHFDRPAAQSVQKAKPSGQHHAANHVAANHHAANHVNLASHHHASKGSHSARNS
ncbi:MAG: hypothetical protein WBW69_24925 [Candidatus Korobacteraceae bacterium]